MSEVPLCLRTLRADLCLGAICQCLGESIFGTGTFNHTQKDFMNIKGDRRQIIISTHVIASWLVTTDVQLGRSRGPGFLFL